MDKSKGQKERREDCRLEQRSSFLLISSFNTSTPKPIRFHGGFQDSSILRETRSKEMLFSGFFNLRVLTMMSHVARMQLAGRITYYLGLLALVCGGLVHLNIASSLFSHHTAQRNLFEVTMTSFMICIASEFRALGENDD